MVEETTSERMSELLEEDDGIVVWWGSSVECHSALNRRLRESSLSVPDLQMARGSLIGVLDSAFEVLPSEAVRRLAQRLLAVYPLAAADSLQLAAALVWAEERTAERGFVCLDQRLGSAAALEGFTVCA